VTLIAGTTSVPLPEEARVLQAASAHDMRAAVMAELPHADALLMAAAVADFRPRRPAETKLTRDRSLTLELEPTPDILAEAARSAPSGAQRPVLVGFAAETGTLERAAAKAERKGVDILVANDVAEEGSGFGVDTNRVTLFAPGLAPEAWPLLTKDQVAHRLLDRVSALLLLRDAGGDGSRRAQRASPVQGAGESGAETNRSAAGKSVSKVAR
jgi:phosphopantothenoylcysteine decarboxylase/phosphopantothenate--cysteine ligase